MFGGLLADHDVGALCCRRSVGMIRASTTRKPSSVNLQFWVDHGKRVVDAHFAGARPVDRRIDRSAGLPDIGVGFDAS